MSLRQTAFKGVFWAFAEQFGSQIVSFLTSLVLARLLLPSDFGTVALFGVVMAVAKVFLDSGLAGSLIRSTNLEEKDLSTVFWFNLTSGIVLYLVIFVTAPLVADFYDVPLLTSLIRVYGTILIIDSFVSVQNVQFVKRMDFKTNFKIQLPSILIGGISGVSFAYFGYGPWALVYAALIQNTVYALQYWFYSDWRPSWLFDRSRFTYHFSFGSKMMLSSLLDVTFNNIYTIIIGKKFSISQLGYYNRADSLKQLPVNNISGALNRVSFPLFAKLSEDNVKLRSAYKKLLSLVIFVVSPVIGLMVVSAEPLIKLLLTEKWLPAVPYFQILSIAGVLYPIHSYNLNILQVKGRSDLFLKLEVLKKGLIIIVVMLSLPFGIWGLVWGQVVISILALFVNTHYTAKFLNYNMIDQLKDLLPSIFIAGVVASLIWCMDHYYFNMWTDFFRLLSLSVVYFLIYIGFSFLFRKADIVVLKDLILRR